MNKSLMNIGMLIESVETQFLGRQGLSFSIASNRTQWQPEDPEGCCWRCAGSVGAYETDGDGCAGCRGKKLEWDRAMRLGHYDGIIRDAVLDLKFRRWRLTGTQLGRVFGREIADRLETMGLNPSEARLVPIPMTRRRRIRRGVDHTMVLARGVSGTTGIPITRVLRARSRAEQIGLSATQRTKNMRGAFYVPSSMLSGRGRAGFEGVRALIVIDDVRTTGATLSEGCKVLRRALREEFGADGVEIWAGSVAMAGGERKGDRLGEGEF